MTESLAPALSIEPVISWPREAVAGKQYLLTVDLRTSQVGDDWPFPDEEVEFRCLLDAYPLFVSSPLDDPVLVLHRFGGTYRPVRYLLNAQSFPADDAPDAVYLNLTTRWGVPLRTVRLPVRLVAQPSPVFEALTVPLSSPAPSFPLQAATLPEIPPPVDLPEPEPEPEQPAARERAGPGRTVLLEVREFQDLTRWRWVLSDESGALLADFEVRLDQGSWQFEALTDLARYLSWHTAPDAATSDEARIIDQVGAWIGAKVLGSAADVLADLRPVTIRLALPEAARALLQLPLELAHAGREPLTLRDMTLVWDTNRDLAFPSASAVPVTERLRVLGLFSLPEGLGQPLNLRRERYSLVTMIEGIKATGRAVDVRMLQYGVTRDRLREMLEEAEGWDIVHISGHGVPGEILLETAAGEPDRVTTDELIDLLEIGRERIKLVTLSSCWSGTGAEENQARPVGLPVRSPVIERVMAAPAGDDPGAPEAMAARMAERLRCAVLAMRYPVADDFATALTNRVYGLLIDKGQPLPRAVAIAMRGLIKVTGEARFPPLSVATPTLIGASAVGLTLAAPARTGPDDFSTAPLKLPAFPPQPERFVGRTRVMARASAALAPGSGVPGVLLYGMPGGGKTASAVELAYTHEHDFERLIWFKAPDEGQDISGSLADFALTLERDLPGFQMAHLISDMPGLRGFLPQLTQLAGQRRILIVLDNAESLLSHDGYWRDERWSLVIGALCAQDGFGRVVLTSRRLPAESAGTGVGSGGLGPGVARLRVLAVDALSLDESLLLARELPHLGRLLAGELPGVNRELARRLAIGVMNTAQGNPKLLELADGLASDPARLAALVEAGDQAREAADLPDGYFTDADQATGSPGTGGDYLQVLAAWTYAIADTLAPGERDLFWFLSCLEESDRIVAVLDGTWAGLWGRLGRDGPPPTLNQMLAVLGARGLAVLSGEGDSYESCAIHPGVAAAGRAAAGGQFRDAVDSEASGFWTMVFREASGEGGGSGSTVIMIRAGLAAAPYLIRLREWDLAATLLERAFLANSSQAVAAAVLPAASRIAASQSRHVLLVATILRVTDPGAAYGELRRCIEVAVEAGDLWAAAAAAARLAGLCLADGRLAEAQSRTEEAAAYTRRAQLGPWTELGTETLRLQVLAATGEAARVLDEARRLTGSQLPPMGGHQDQQEAAASWNVREALVATSRHAAVLTGQWDYALELGVQVFDLMQDRSAPATDLARARFGDYFSLLRLGRADEAFDLLLQCRQVFQDARDTRALGMALSALADTEDARGHGDSVIDLERDALRYKYLNGDVPGIAASYHNLGNYLAVHGRQAAQALASHLAAALIRGLAGIGGTGPASAAGSVAAAAADVDEFGAAATAPAGVADLSRMIGDIPGTDLAGLVARMAPDQAGAERALGELVAQARQATGEDQAGEAGLRLQGSGTLSVGGPGASVQARVEPRSPWVQAPVSSPIPVNQFSTSLPEADQRTPAREPELGYIITHQAPGLSDNSPERHPETRSHALVRNPR